MPKGQVITKSQFCLHGINADNYADLAERIGLTDVAPPMIIKPTSEDNSRGVSLVRTKDPVALKRALKDAFSYGDCILVEDFIDGREIRAGVVEVKKCDLPDEMNQSHEPATLALPAMCEYLLN